MSTNRGKQVDVELAARHARARLARVLTFVDILKSYPRYALEAWKLSENLGLVDEFIQAKSGSGDRDIDEALQVANANYRMALAEGEFAEADASEQSNSVIEVARLETVPEPVRRISQPDPFRPITTIPMTSANSEQYRLAAKTSDVGKEPRPVWNGSGQFNRDTIQIAASPEGKATRIVVRVQSPADLKPGDKLTLTLPHLDSATGVRKLVLNPPGPGKVERIQGSIRLELEFSKFIKGASRGVIEAILEFDRYGEQML